MAPTRRMAAAWLGKIPTTRERRLISLLIRSRGLVDQIFCQCARGNAAKANTSALAASMSGPVLGEPGGELVGNLVPGVADGASVGLGEDGPEQRRGHVLVRLGHHSQQVADEVHPAALAGRSLEPPVRGAGESAVRIRDHQAHASEAPVAQRAQELLPEPFAFAVADVAAKDLPVPGGGDARGDDGGHGGRAAQRCCARSGRWRPDTRTGTRHGPSGAL